MREATQAHAIPYVDIRLLVQQRISTFEEDESFEPNACGYFVVVEPMDSVATLSHAIGFNVLANRYTGVRYDSPAFTPSFEILEEHQACYEIVFVISDDGFGVEVFVPKEQGIDADLLAMCSMHAVPSQEVPEP